MRVAITGTSGFIGRALAQSMAGEHDVVCLSRQKTEVDGVTPIQADFTSPDGLRALDAHELDALIHLAAVTSHGTEEEQLGVNVLGTRRLLRHLIDRGCRKFILASSIAAAGVLCPEFRPLQLPMPDAHPCLDTMGYGFSKYLMEELVRHISRQDGSLDLIVLRLSGILRDDATRVRYSAKPPFNWGMAHLSSMYVSDAIRCLTLAAEAPIEPGCRIPFPRPSARDTATMRMRLTCRITSAPATSAIPCLTPAGSSRSWDSQLNGMCLRRDPRECSRRNAMQSRLRPRRIPRSTGHTTIVGVKPEVIHNPEVDEHEDRIAHTRAGLSIRKTPSTPESGASAQPTTGEAIPLRCRRRRGVITQSGRRGNSGNGFRALSFYQPTAMGGASSSVSRLNRSPGGEPVRTLRPFCYPAEGFSV